MAQLTKIESLRLGIVGTAISTTGLVAESLLHLPDGNAVNFGLASIAFVSLLALAHAVTGATGEKTPEKPQTKTPTGRRS